MRRGVADKQLDATIAVSAFQKQWFSDLRRRVFDERAPYALVQADVPFELFDLCDIPAISNQWWAAMIAAKRQAARLLDAMTADGFMAICAATAALATRQRVIATRSNRRGADCQRLACYAPG
jgi:hypothetical protein